LKRGSRCSGRLMSGSGCSERLTLSRRAVCIYKMLFCRRT
jgi:hypothetical protein